MSDRTSSTRPQKLTRETLREILNGIPDREYAERLAGAIEALFAHARRLQEPPPEATVRELMAGLRASSGHLRSLGACLAEMPESLAAQLPEELRGEVRGLAMGLEYIGRFDDRLYGRLEPLVARIEEAWDA